jgi:hypothetical protein
MDGLCDGVAVLVGGVTTKLLVPTDLVLIARPLATVPWQVAMGAVIPPSVQRKRATIRERRS